MASSDLTEVFGRPLAPSLKLDIYKCVIVEAGIRAIYLGIMGLIGFFLTENGVNFFLQVRREAKAEVKPEVQVPAHPTAELTSQSFAKAMAQILGRKTAKKSEINDFDYQVLYRNVKDIISRIRKRRREAVFWSRRR